VEPQYIEGHFEVEWTVQSGSFFPGWSIPRLIHPCY